MIRPYLEALGERVVPQVTSVGLLVAPATAIKAVCLPEEHKAPHDHRQCKQSLREAAVDFGEALEWLEHQHRHEFHLHTQEHFHAEHVHVHTGGHAAHKEDYPPEPPLEFPEEEMDEFEWLLMGVEVQLRELLWLAEQ